MGIWPPGWPYIGFNTPTVSPLIMKKYCHALSWMYFYSYLALSNGSNWEFICLIPIFVVIFGQNVGFWPPGVLIYRVTPHCVTINFEEIPLWFVLNVFLLLLCTIKSFKLGIYLHNTRIWGHFGQNMGIWPHGLLIYDKVRDSCYILWPKVFILRITERHFKVFFSYVKKSHDFKSFFGNTKLWFLSELSSFLWFLL